MYRFCDKYFDLTRLEQCAAALQGRRWVLFGAAGWGRALLAEIRRRWPASAVVFCDNDQSKHGRWLAGVPIIGPARLHPQHDAVVITSVSAGDQISRQLEELGFRRNATCFEVMRSLDPDQPMRIFENFAGFFAGDARSFLQGKEVLHIGPGGNLGVELLLAGHGARRVWSLECHSFGLCYPQVQALKSFYLALARDARSRHAIDFFERKLLFYHKGRLCLDTGRIRLIMPASVEALPFRTASFDLVLHHLVFEHVPDPEQGYGEIYRVLKPGAGTVGFVNPQDHRSAAGMPDMHPLKFLEMPRAQWLRISAQCNLHNQHTMPEHRRHLAAQGFGLMQWRDLDRFDISDDLWAGFDPMFRRFARRDLGVLLFAFHAQKPPTV